MKSLQFNHKSLKGKEVLVDFKDTVQITYTTYVRCYTEYSIPREYINKEHEDLIMKKECLYVPVTWVRFVTVCPWRRVVRKVGHPKTVKLSLFELISRLVMENVHYGGRCYQFG